MSKVIVSMLFISMCLGSSVANSAMSCKNLLVGMNTDYTASIHYLQSMDFEKMLKAKGVSKSGISGILNDGVLQRIRRKFDDIFNELSANDHALFVYKFAVDSFLNKFKESLRLSLDDREIKESSTKVYYDARVYNSLRFFEYEMVLLKPYSSLSANLFQPQQQSSPQSIYYYSILSRVEYVKALEPFLKVLVSLNGYMLDRERVEPLLDSFIFRLYEKFKNQGFSRIHEEFVLSESLALEASVK